MALERLKVWRYPPAAHFRLGTIRMVSISDGQRQVNVAFGSEAVRQPGHVRQELYHAMRNNFPNYQRTIPRRLRREPKRARQWR